jgi:hypothetical protein
MLAVTDRVAAAAAGLAVPKHLGSNVAVMNRPIFCQKQIARAVEPGLGTTSPEAIDLVAANPDSQDYDDKVAIILVAG